MNYTDLLKEAEKVSQNAYAPYSDFRVGACALYESGNFYCGCNVENSSYGLCLCAERNAMSTAIAAGEKTPLVAIAIFSPKTARCIPCGSCLQWMAELEKGQGIKVVIKGKDGVPEVIPFTEMMPYRFEFVR